MDTSDSMGGVGGHAAPLGLVRSGLALADVLAAPLLVLAFLVVVTAALGALGAAAGGINFVLGLRYLDFFPTFPPMARTLSGMTLLGFAALMASSTLLLWRFFRKGWKRYWSWHHSAWAGSSREPAARAAGLAAGRRTSLAAMWISGIVFLFLLAVSFALMMVMAGGPFWHAWRWFV